MRSVMKGPPIRLTLEQAKVIVPQFQETAAYRQWLLLATAVMANHAHLVIGVPGDPDPQKLLHDFKSYASRVLNRQWGKPSNGTWLTESGSKRRLRYVPHAVEYVRNQEYPLVTLVNDLEYERYFGPGERGQ